MATRTSPKQELAKVALDAAVRAIQDKLKDTHQVEVLGADEKLVRQVRVRDKRDGAWAAPHYYMVKFSEPI